MKFLLLVMISLWSVPTLAEPYLAYKHEQPFHDSKSQPDFHSLHLGYMARDMYIEAGPTSDGHSIEMGYQFLHGNWTLKSKYEGAETSQHDYFESKIETKIIYKFSK